MVNDERRLVLPFTPITKKNHQEIVVNRSTGRAFVMPSPQYRLYENNCVRHIALVWHGDEIVRPVNVKCLFYMPTKRRCDLVNLLQAVDDILVKGGVLYDDNYRVVAGHDGSRVLLDRKNPRTEIFITEMEDDEDGANDNI